MLRHPPILIAVKHIKDYILELEFEDKVVKVVDLTPYFSPPKYHIFKLHTKIEDFSKAYVNPSFNALSWGDNEIDLNPDNFYNGECAYQEV